MPSRPPSNPLIVLTAASERFWRSLWQLLAAVERRGLVGEIRIQVGDLGLSPATRARLEAAFPWCEFTGFDFAAHPPHVARLGNYAWKPLLIAAVFRSGAHDLLWLDSATLLHASLDEFRGDLAQHGLYTLVNQSTIKASTDARTLTALGVEPSVADAPMLAGGVVGFAGGSPAARAVLGQWAELALRPGVIDPPPPACGRHRFDQSLLSIVAQRAVRRGELTLYAGAIDVSAADPVRWLSTRNKVHPAVPVWLDAGARAWSRIWKACDRQAIRLRRFKATRIDGFHRWPREEFRVALSGPGDPRPRVLPAPPWSYLADPFVWLHDGRPWLFVERFSYRENRGHLAVLPLDRAVSAGIPAPLVVEGAAPGHRSFPFIFEYDGRPWLLPESSANRSVDLLACEDFPWRWRLHRRLLADVDAADSILLPHRDRWWLFTSVRAEGAHGRSLAIFHGAHPFVDRWEPHPVNAVRLYADQPFSGGRSAGAPVRRSDGTWLRPMHASRRYYGESFQWMRIVSLTPTDFAEVPFEGESPLPAIASGVGLHHATSAGEWSARDARTRVSYGQHIPGWNRWALRPTAPSALTAPTGR